MFQENLYKYGFVRRYPLSLFVAFLRVVTVLYKAADPIAANRYRYKTKIKKET